MRGTIGCSSLPWPLVLVVPLMLAGCPSDDGGHGADATGSTGSTTVGNGETGGTTTGVADETTAGDSTGGSLGCEAAIPLVEPMGDPVSFDIPQAIDPEVVCPMLAGDIPIDFFSALRIIRPATLTGEWPGQKLPVIVFSPGAAQDHLAYDHLFEPLASEGFVSVLVETSRIDQDENLSVSTRASILACTLRWLASQWPDREHLSCDLVLAGHSRGGGAAFLTAGSFANIPWNDIDPQGIDFELRGLVSIAGAATGDDTFPGDPVPFLGLVGATDEDPVGQLVLQYDRVIPDEVAAANPADLPPKFMLLPYDVPHNAWGGGVPIFGSLPPTLTPQEHQAKAEAIWLVHAPLFLRWSVLGQDAGIARARLAGDDVPASLNEPQWWSSIQPAYAELGDLPVIPRAFTVDTLAAGGQRLVIDDFDSGGTFDARSFTGIAQPGPPADLVADNDWQGLTNHRSDALFVEWGDDPQAPGPRGGALEWPLAHDVSSFELLSLRIGQLPQGVFGLPPEGMPCELTTPTLAEPDLPDLTGAVSIDVSVSDGNDSAAQTITPIIQQELRRVVQNTSNGSIAKCVVVNHLQTLRVPLSSFEGVDLTNLTGLTLTFDPRDELSAVLIDTIELTTE